MKETSNANRLFLASCIALVVTSMTFAIRANLIGVLGEEFGLSGKEMGIVFGTAFWGFTLAMMFGGPLVDVLGMKKIILLAFLGHVSGIILTIMATGFASLFISTLLVGIANGLVEAACNPLVATLYPNEKTKRLNMFHVWFPGGIVIGGLTAFLLTEMNLSWQIQMASMLLPAFVYGFMFVKEKLPVTERVASGVSTADMFKECLKPLFLFMVVCMLLTASTELGTNQWIVELLGNVGVPAILILVFINGLMAVGRTFAGPVEKRLSTSGMLLFSAVFSAIGLVLLSFANGYAAFAAATIFAVGICYFWPTMLAFVSENLPKTGALGLSIMGGAGMLSVSFILPIMGDFYDSNTALALPTGYTIDMVKNAIEGTENFNIFSAAKLTGGSITLRYVAILPTVLVAAFAFLYMNEKKKHQEKTEEKVTTAA
jgi:fucose permease